MSPKKLTEEDKQEILKLYRHTLETTSTLATRYGVSSSTISRFLKSSLSEPEYDILIQQKRLARTATLEQQLELEIAEPPKARTKVAVRASSAEKLAVLQRLTETETPQREELEKDVGSVDVIALSEILGEDLSDLDELDEDDELDDEDEEWEEDELEPRYSPSVSTKIAVKVLPLSAAALPKTCYLVIDRAAELITRPLKEFADLGKIPAEEFQQKTLPVFDNHRVARRFSNRSQRVIKVPDGRMLQKTHSYLEAKGITRILLDGQIYSL